ncbi:MAG: ABC transporter ATP-binding protein, partial [Desulfobacterales bacterium]|nr:ABC transporter ATP-binding protein [Desulfobacterales bacterium]
EPTNHLDMESCDALLAAIDSFDGTVIMVTHNEMFLHALAERLIVFKPEGVEVFDGGYARFLEERGWEEEGGASRGGRKIHSLSRTIGTMTKKEIRKKRSRIIADKSRVLKPIQKKVDKLEANIEARENERADLNSKMLEASLTGDGAEIADLSRKIHACQAIVDKMYEDLDMHASELDARSEEFEKMLSNLEAAEVKKT